MVGKWSVWLKTLQVEQPQAIIQKRERVSCWYPCGDEGRWQGRPHEHRKQQDYGRFGVERKIMNHTPQSLVHIREQWEQQEGAGIGNSRGTSFQEGFWQEFGSICTGKCWWLLNTYRVPVPSVSVPSTLKTLNLFHSQWGKYCYYPRWEHWGFVTFNNSLKVHSHDSSSGSLAPKST